MDNKDFLQISNALRDGSINSDNFLETLNSFGDNTNLSVVLDSAFHKIANTDHSKENNRLPISSSELPGVYELLINETINHLQSKMNEGSIEKSDYQLFSTLNYNFGNALVRKTEVMPLNNDPDLKEVIIKDQLPTAIAEKGANLLNDFREGSQFLDLEDISLALRNKLEDFDASSTEKDINSIVNLYKKQSAFVAAKNDGEEIINFSEYQDIINDNERNIASIIKRADLNLARDEEDTPFLKLANELDKPAFEEEIKSMKDSIKDGVNIFDRRLEISLLRSDVQEALQNAEEPGLTISQGPTGPKIQNKNNNQFHPQDELQEFIDWNQKYQEYLKELNLRELKTYDKTKMKMDITSPNKFLSSMKLLGDSVVSLNELGNPQRTFLNISPLTGTMRLGNDVMPESEDGAKAFRLAALNARRKGWDKVYLNHTGKDAEAIPFIKESIRAMVEHGNYELDEIKVPKRFQKLLEDYRLSRPGLTISNGANEDPNLDYVSVSSINQPQNGESLEEKAMPDKKAPEASKPEETVPSEKEAIPTEAPVEKKEEKVEEKVESKEKKVDVSDLTSNVPVDSNIPMDVIQQKGQPPVDDYNVYDGLDFSDIENLSSGFDNYNDTTLTSTKPDFKEKTLELYQHSTTLSETNGGYVHKPIFELAKDLIESNENGYWDSISGLKSKDTSIALAIQSVSKNFLEQGLVSPEASEMLGELIKNGKIEKTMEKALDRELTSVEKDVVKKHYDSISNYVQNFANRGDHEIVLFTPNGVEEVKNSHEQFEEITSKSEFKRSGDRKNQEMIAQYAKMKSAGDSLEKIYSTIDASRLSNEGYQMPEFKKMSSDQIFENDLNKSENNSQTRKRNNRSPS